MDESTAPRGNFLYPSAPNLGANNSQQTTTQMPINTFHLQSGGGDCFQSGAHPIVKTEATTSQHVQKFHHYPLMSSSSSRGGGGPQSTVQAQQHHHHHENDSSSNDVEAIKAKIIAHPQYSNLLEAYMDCQKVLFLY